MQREDLLRTVQYALQTNDKSVLRRALDAAHAANIADIIEELDPDERIVVFNELPEDVRGEVLDELEVGVRNVLLQSLGPDAAADIFDAMPSDDAAEALGDLPPEEAQSIIERMESEEAEEVLELLGHEDETAGRIMATEVLTVLPDITIDQAIDCVRAEAQDAETTYAVYVVDEDNRLLGALTLEDLILADPQSLVRDVMETDIVKIPVTMDQEEAARIVSKYDLVAVPAVDEEGRLVGVITIDDLVDVLVEEATEDIYRLAGTHEDSEFRRPALLSAFRRMPWLVVTFVGELISGSIIRHYNVALSSAAQIAVFIPLVMAVGGNVGNQSVATTVRAIATDELRPTTPLAAVLREVLVGLLVGASTGALAAIVAWVWFGPHLAVAVGMAMALSQSLSAGVGTGLPLIFRAIGQDPALASAPFISTLNDILGVGLYFALATVFV